MSALPPKADIDRRVQHVRFVPDLLAAFHQGLQETGWVVGDPDIVSGSASEAALQRAQSVRLVDNGVDALIKEGTAGAARFASGLGRHGHFARIR
jgi:hypothetical protein